jgi:hypothetical protein
VGGVQDSASRLDPRAGATVRRDPTRIETVASNTKATENARLKKSRKTGQKRKKLLARGGTTKSEAQMFGSTIKR